ncbi:MAG: chaperone NapD [Desulfuromonadaceae bacterium]|nr:chaperone NapD [Desulfuromonadaceae bacterium]
MPVSGVVLRCLEGCADSASAEISLISGVEVHGVLPEGQIIAVIEADTVQQEVNLVSEFHDVNNDITARLAYYNFEDV